MKELLRWIRGCWFFVLGNLLALFSYDRKYLKGRWFEGRFGGICALGWQWVTRDALACRFTAKNREARFPVNQYCTVICPENIEFDPDDLNNFQSYGIYYQALGKIRIGKGTYIGPNVGLITSNHDPRNLERHLEPLPVELGENCWIGMNSVILPGVILGDHTVVGAGSVVTKSFVDGNCILAGNPARLIREISQQNDGKK